MFVGQASGSGFTGWFWFTAEEIALSVSQGCSHLTVDGVGRCASHMAHSQRWQVCAALVGGCSSLPPALSMDRWNVLMMWQWPSAEQVIQKSTEEAVVIFKNKPVISTIACQPYSVWEGMTGV